MTGLQPATLKQLSALSHLRSLAKDQIVLRAGEEAAAISFVRTGILRVQKDFQDGRHHVVALLIEGDMFGRLFDGPMPFGIEAATDAQIIAFPRAAFENLVLRCPDLERLVTLEFLNELDRARDWMIVLGNSRMRRRVAGFLVMLHSRFSRLPGLVERQGEGILIRLPIGRKDIASLLGTRTESISRALHALASDGIVEIVQPHLVLVPDLDALADEAGDLPPAGLDGLDHLAALGGTPQRAR